MVKQSCSGSRKDDLAEGLIDDIANSMEGENLAAISRMPLLFNLTKDLTIQFPT